eukprot:6094009-Ditylum_brightwellii.AAC.1
MAVAAQTWVNLKIHVNRAHREMLELLRATQQAPGYTANNVFHAMYPVAMETNAAAEALANLAQATDADHTAVANLATANTRLTTKVANLTTKLNAKDKDISALTEKLGNLQQPSKSSQASKHPVVTGTTTTPTTKLFFIVGHTALPVSGIIRVPHVAIPRKGT